ncbi:alpha/beta fold hydrolase [Imbroritus primus]|uniref:Alpha/beta fold hydrolase n=1 Tax=Imbroritus primus TaxID=3058603 RepID=A0ACD3SRD3_9BURK|nr:alpha/beta fold hydrolase [Burkholderiaceae bacterium PBA]
MAYIKNFLLPRLGDIDSVRVVNWNVAPGAAFAAGDILLEIETDKSIVEVVAEEDGKLVEQLVPTGESMDATAPVARIEVTGEAPDEEQAASASSPAASLASSASNAQPGFYIKDFLLPRLGDIDSVRVVNWNVAPGTAFATGDILLEIETDKSIVEVVAEEDGKLVEQLVPTGESMDATAPVARIEVAGEAPLDDVQAAPAAQTRAQATAAPAASAPSTPTPLPAGARVFATPAARRVAAERGIDLAALTGTGPGGRITVADAMSATPGTTAGTGAGAAGARAAQEELQVATPHGTVFATRWSAARGNAATVVLIHGLFGDTDTWASTVSTLTRTGLNVLALDLPCHGRSAASVTSFTMLVDTVAAALDKLCRGPVLLAGHSLGSAVAARIARQGKLQVRGLTLFSPAGLGTEINQSFIDGMLHAHSDEALEREARKLTATAVNLSAAYLRKLRERIQAKAEPLGALCRDIGVQGVQQFSIQADLEALRCPITIVHGRSDAIIPWQHALNAPARAALHLVPQAGHMPQAEAMVLAGEVIERMVRSI